MRSGAERTRQTGLWKRWLAVILAAVVTAGAVPVNFLGVKAAEGTPVVTDAAQETERISEETQVEVEAAEAEVHGSEKTDSDEPDSEEPDLETAASDIAASDNTDPGTAEDLPASEVDGGEADNKESEAPAQSAEKEHKEAAQAEEDMSAAETAEGAAEEPADGEGDPEQDEVRSISIEEVDPVAVSISDAFKEELSTADGETFYFKHTPDLFSGRRFFRTYATQNASVMAYAYDQGGNLVAEAESIGEKEVTLSFSVSNRNTYYIQVELKAENPEEGPGTSKILFATSESYGFSCQTVGGTLRTGLVNSQMTLSVKASAMTELSYQWVIENETIEGETSDSYTFTVGQGYMYLCLVTDELGHTYRCRFQVRADNQLSVYPESGEPGDTTADIHVEPGEEAQLKVVASAIDETGISYEWERYITRQTPMGTLVGRREHINGADGDTLTLESPQTGGIFYCTVRDMYSSREIRFNTYVDNELTAYIGEAGSTSAGVTSAPGEAVAFDVFATAKDSSQLTYMWYKESDLLAQTQEGAYEITSPMSASYSCTVSDQYGNSKKITLKVLVENELTVYAGATQDTQDDVYVFEGDPAVLPVDVSAIDEEGMTYVWQKRVLRSGGEYTWTKISAAAGPEYTAETFEDEDQFRCEVTDRFGNSAVITFTVHVLEDAHYLAVRLLDPAGNVLTDGFTVSWYAEDGTVQGTGKKIHSVSANTQYECRISLGEDLGCRYVQPEPAFYNSGENSETFDLSLVEYGVVKVTGTVTDKTGEAVAGASVKLKQIFNGEFTRILEAETDASGAFALDARKTRSNLIVSADGYFDGYYAIPAETEEDVSVEAVLEKIPANRITLKLFRRDAAHDGEEQVTTELTSANGLEISARNVTKAAEITDLKFQFPYVVLGEGAAEPGDSILLSAQCDKAGMTADQIEVTLDNMSCAEAEWTFVQNGKIRIKDITGNDENVVMVFDADGQCVQSGIASAAFTGSPLPEGKYSCVLMKKTDALRSVDIFGRLAEFGLAEGTDYVKLEAEVHKGIITEITGVKVPALHMDGLVYTVEENTRFWANRMENVTGQYVQMRLSYEIDEEYASAEETVTIEVPEGMTFVERSLTLDGRACECRVEEHDGAQTVTIPAGRKSILRFYVLPTASGDKNVFANLSFSEGGETVRQPLGALTIGVSAASIIVPDKTGQKTVTVTGQAIADCEITVYDNDTAVGTTTSKKSGTWALTFDLVDPRKYSNHRIFATVKSEEFGVDIETDAAELFYNCNYVELSKVTMINTAHPAGNLKPTEFRTVFDFLHPSTAIPFYRYWPKYPAFTFVVEFTKDSADAVSDVCVITTNSAGDKTRIDCEYDEENGAYIGTHDYLEPGDTPFRISVSCDNNSDTVYDFTLDKEELDEMTEIFNSIEAEFEETLGDKTKIENREESENRLSCDIEIDGGKTCNYCIEIIDFEATDFEKWCEDHEVTEENVDGSVCYVSQELSERSFTTYIFNYEEQAMLKETITVPQEALPNMRRLSKTASPNPSTGKTNYQIFIDSFNEQIERGKKKARCCTDCEAINGNNIADWEIMQAESYIAIFEMLVGGKIAVFRKSDIWHLYKMHYLKIIDCLLRTASLPILVERTRAKIDYHLKRAERNKKTCLCIQPCKCGPGEGDGLPAKGEFDPSGYVYEAVPSNRVSGVKAEAYYYDYAVDEFGVQEDEKSEILWDAENYDQVNPQYTDADGTFGWDVPEGQWLVKFSKEGYEDTDSRQDVAADEDGYLPVPPIQTEVNTAIVSKAAPEVSTVEAYPDEIRIEFSQYMQIGSVSAANVGVTSGGKTVPGTIKALNAEENYEKTEQFASYFAFVPDKELSGTVKVNVSSVKNYCGKAMAGSYSKDHDVKIMPKGLEIIGSRNILYRGSEELTIRVVPAEAGAGRTITVASYSPSIVAAQEQKITADRNGTAKVVLSGNLPGQGILSVSLDGTRISEEITATVSMTQSSVSLEEGGYSVKLAEDAVPYSGRPITPAVTVDGLTEGTDFSVSYKNNTDPGTVTVTVTGMGSYTGTITGTFLILPGKTSRGDMFNLANNVKVTWTEVPGANYYKVYREGITDKKESLTEPVIVTTGLVGWDSQAGLTNGHAYRYKIVASLTGKGDPSGDSRLSYSKVMYRLKTTAWKYVKNTAPGKVTASYQKSASGDSYVILYADNEDMTGAKSKVIFGADTTSVVLGGFRKGKTYWFQIRVRKKVNGIDYYTTFGVKKPVRITR